MKNSRQLRRRSLNILKVTELKRITHIVIQRDTLDFLNVVTNTIANAQHHLEILWVTNLVAIV